MMNLSQRSSSLASSSGRSSVSEKLDYLYEVTVEPEHVNPTTLPLLNPYSSFSRLNTSTLGTIKSLIKSRPRGVKEYVQASKLDQCPIPATGKEQFITLHIPPDFPNQWKQQGYTHIHFGAVRFSLSFHGRKGLPVVARIALLDSRFVKYQHACIATVETTLNAGTVFVTLFPNFNMSLSDPHLLEALKVQVQIYGAEQISDSIAATLHYQMAYRVQNHALDLTLPGGEDALLIKIDEQNSATCTHVPRQISRDNLIQLLPEAWVTDYEKLHQAVNQPIESTDSKMITKSDGSVVINFDHSHLQDKRKKQLPQISMVQIPMDDPKPWRKPRESLIDLISNFDSNASPAHYFQDPFSGHIYFDICYCRKCYKPKDPKVEKTRCKHHKEDKPDADKDLFSSLRSTFDGIQIPDQWMNKEKKKPVLHPYYQECLEIIHKEFPEPCNIPDIPKPLPQVCMFNPSDFPSVEET